MASLNDNYKYIVIVLLQILYWSCKGDGQSLSSTFYDTTCPNVTSIVKGVVEQAVAQDARMAASLLRLHFHDCFPNGCDGSILLDDTSTFTGEQTAPPNNNSIRGMDVVDDIKTAVESVCPGIVSCADILAIASEVGVAYVGGPTWTVLLGRRDGTTAATSQQVIASLPAPTDSLDTIKSKFSSVGLNTQDVVVLSGGHTIGRSRCVSFSSRLYDFNGTGSPDPTMDSSYITTLQGTCPEGGNGNALADLDQSTGDTFDNGYFSNLVSNKGLLQSDQELFSTPGADTISLVQSYSSDQDAFFSDFGNSMISMGNINVLTGSSGEIHATCGQVNSR